MPVRSRNSAPIGARDRGFLPRRASGCPRASQLSWSCPRRWGREAEARTLAHGQRQAVHRVGRGVGIALNQTAGFEDGSHAAIITVCAFLGFKQKRRGARAAPATRSARRSRPFHGEGHNAPQGLGADRALGIGAARAVLAPARDRCGHEVRPQGPRSQSSFVKRSASSCATATGRYSGTTR